MGACATCDTMPKLTEILRNCGTSSKIAQARLLLLCMQRRFESLRFNPGCNVEKAGDVIESTGGILSPWRVSARVVLHYLANLFNLSDDGMKETVEAMDALARQCKHLLRTHAPEGAEQGRPKRQWLTLPIALW